jgi:hypothetical protein
MSEKKEKIVEIELKLKKRHPRKSFRIGRHVVGVQFAAFEMNEAEMKELKGKGASAWLISKEDFEAAKKAKKVPAKNNEK